MHVLPIHLSSAWDIYVTLYIENTTMKNAITSLLILTICFTSCLDDCPSCPECEEVDNNPIYRIFAVNFFHSHKDFELRPAAFETVTEQVLTKPAHNIGTTFSVVTETYLYKSAYTYLEIYESDTAHVVVNAEANTIGEIACFNFYQEADFKEIEIGAEYRNRQIQVVVTPGTGALVPAEYGTIQRKVLVLDAQLIPTNEREKTSVTFKIPADESIQVYLDTQFSQQGIPYCIEENAYEVIP